MSGALDTLFYALKSDSSFSKNEKILFFNAQNHPDLESFSKESLFFQQYFKPYEEGLARAGYIVSPDVPDKKEKYETVIIVASKNIKEMQYFIAQALEYVNDGGCVYCAADNKAGGGRLKKIFQDFGLKDISEESRNKARCVRGGIDYKALDRRKIEWALKEGGIQRALDGCFYTQAGVFGWNKVDRGSKILTQHIPEDLKGQGADFGCGYGYLSDFIMVHCPKVKSLSCIDADYRAVQLCEKNMRKYEKKKEFIWADLTCPLKHIKNLDFIVMNPPFHEGKKEDMAMGQMFIKNAALSLRRGGYLWMVSNAHLPYENALKNSFFSVEKIYEGQGFKVFKALK